MAKNGHDNRNLPVRGHVNPWGCRRDAAVQSMHEVYSMGLFGAQIASLPTKYFLDFFLILGSSVHCIVRFMVPNSVILCVCAGQAIWALAEHVCMWQCAWLVAGHLSICDRALLNMWFI